MMRAFGPQYAAASWMPDGEASARPVIPVDPISMIFTLPAASIMLSGRA